LKNDNRAFGVFFTVFGIFYVALTCFSFFLTSSVLPDINIPYFLVLCVFNISLSFSITQNMLSMCYGIKEPPKLKSLPTKPMVAVLYTTRDDVNEDCLRDLRKQRYGFIDIFVLDDSLMEESKAIIDTYSKDYVIIRRDTRRGKKAGNLNNWLRLYGHKYPFFVILDNDSLIGTDFVERMLHYALHPQNFGTAAFQAVIEIKNPASHFTEAFNCEKRKGNRIALSLYNRLGFYFGWGHNVMYRTDAVLKNGMFNESFVGEDIELGLRLLERGYELEIVDILSHEGFNDNILKYSIREGRICQSNLQVLMARKWSISVASYFFLLILNLNSLYLPLIMAMNAIFLCNAVIVSTGPIFASMYIDYYTTEYLMYNFSLFSVYLLFPILMDILVFESSAGRITGMINKARLAAYHLSLHVFLFSRIIEYFFKRKVYFHVTNSRERPARKLVILYEFSALFYVIFSILIFLIARKLFLVFSIWFFTFLILSALNLGLRYNSIKRGIT